MKECDLVMKGGTTSGIIYPPAIYEIGKEYRLRSVAGSSAGAIASTVAVAAEYRRQVSADQSDFTGFEMVAALSKELGEDLTRFLQPSQKLKPLFDAFIAYQTQRQKLEEPLTRKSWVKIIREVAPILKPYWKKPARNGALIAAGGTAAGVLGAGFGIGALGVTLGVVVGIGQFVVSFVLTVFKHLKDHDFGMVPGTTQDNQTGPSVKAISDWLADKIDIIAGRSDNPINDRPLTIGDLRNGKDGRKPGIELAAMTTDLTSKRPYSLPFTTPNLYYFSQSELELVLPRRVVDYMVKVTAVGKKNGPNGDLYPVPTGNDFPIVLAARMSLSFPILLQAVPLWREDIGAESGDSKWVRCLFSDGGISSNLPVHFFDRWLPRRPTFAIALGELDEARHSDERVHFDQGVRDRRSSLPVARIDSVFGFLFAIFNTAKDWQDTLQSEMPGMYERVVTVRLKSDEGGTNLAMPKKTITRLRGYGEKAGKRLVGEFRFDENRWRRALCILPKIEEELPRLHDAIAIHATGPEGWTYEELAKHYDSGDYPQDQTWRDEVLIPFLEVLSALGKETSNKEKGMRISDGNLPEIDANLRLVASSDLSEQGRGTA